MCFQKAHEKWKEMGDSYIQQWLMNNHDEVVFVCMHGCVYLY